MATGADLGYPAVEGPRPARMALINAYFNRPCGWPTAIPWWPRHSWK